MTSDALIAVALTVACWALSGARSLAVLLYFLAFLPFVSLDPSSGGLRDLAGLTGANVVFKLGLRAATTLGFAVLLMRRRGALADALQPRAWPVWLFVSWAALGLVQVPVPSVAAFRLGELLSFYLIGVALWHELEGRFPLRLIARWHCLALLPLCLASLWFAHTRPELAYHVGPGGLRLGHKLIEANVLGFSAGVLILWAAHELRSVTAWRAPRALGLAGVALVLSVAALVLFLSRSRTAFIATVTGLLVLGFPIDWSPRRRALFVVCGALLLGLAAWGHAQVVQWFLRGGDLDQVLTGTGRTGLWRELLREQVPRSPLVGMGYLALGREGWFAYGGARFDNAHNAYLFALVSTGVPGFLAVATLTLLPLVRTFARLVRGPRTERGPESLLLAVQVTVAITSITGFGVCGHPNAAMLASYALYARCARAPRARPRAHSLPRPWPLLARS